MARPARAVRKVVLWLVRIFFALMLAFPFYWMLITTFKRSPDLYNLKNNPFLFNEPPTLEHLRLLFNETLFLRWIGNTAFAGAVVVIITLVLAVPAAYRPAGLALVDHPGVPELHHSVLDVAADGIF